MKFDKKNGESAGPANELRRTGRKAGSGGWMKILRGGTETGVALVLVVVCFLILLGAMTAMLPEGSGLRGLMRSGALSSLSGGGTDRAEDRVQVATLSEVLRKVKDKPSGGIAWAASSRGIPLGRQHAIQTYEESGATIAFDEGSEISLGENSLVVLKDYEVGTEDHSRRASMVVLSGELRGRITGGAGEALTVQVVTAGGTSEIGPGESAEEDASFRVAVHEDQSATLSVYEGTAQVLSGGETVVVEANEALVLGPSEDDEPAVVIPLPGPPSLSAPEEGAVTIYRASTPEIRFRWLRGTDCDHSRLVIARDREFRDVIHDSRESREEFTHTGLTAGTYHWKVSGVSGDLEGPAGRPRTFRIARDMAAPKLQIDFPTGPVNSDRLVLRGNAEPGSVVFIQTEEVVVDENGQFEHTIALERGLNVVVVEVLDRVGNTTYRSEYVSAKY